MKKTILTVFFGVLLMSLSAHNLVVNVHSNAEAYGNVIIGYNGEAITSYVWCEDHFIDGVATFNETVSSSYNVNQLQVNVWGGTSWSDWIETGWQVGFTDPPDTLPTIDVYINFDYPKEMVVSIDSNSDAENCIVLLYNSLNNLVDSKSVDLQNNDYNSSGIIDVLFSDIFDEIGDYANYSVQISGTNDYGFSKNETSTGFTYNSVSGEWENSINFNFTLPAKELKKYKSGWNWISYPRLYRAADNGFDAEVVLDDLEPYSLQIDSEGNNRMVFDPYGSTWSHINLDNLKSSEGYKLLMNNGFSQYSHYTYGSQLPEQYQVSLTGNTIENWVGYWIDDTQIISDALGDYWTDTNIRTIKMQYWSADRDPFNNDKWVCSGRIPTISYGDMVVIKCTNSTPYFRWDTGTPREKVTIPQAEYYNYTEQADYTPLYLVLDSENQPKEIGAFVDDQCIGATVVNDTLVQLNLYTDYRANGEIEFEYYYGERNSNAKVSNYKYHGLTSSRASSGKLSTSRLKGAYLVDLRNQNESIPEVENKLTANNYQNPFNPTTEINFSLPQTSNVDIKIYNVKGQEIITLFNNGLKEGNHSVVWNGKDANNNSVSSGLYFYKILTKDNCLTKRMILMK